MSRQREQDLPGDVAMRKDHDVAEDVMTELRWTPDLNEKDIAVKVTDGIVTLTGFVRSYPQKRTAERAAKRILGVQGVANDIEVRLEALDAVPDPVIARDALAAIKRELPAFEDKIKILVRNGRITLEGQVDWWYQYSTADRAVRHVRGVVGVSNLLTVKPAVAPADVKRRIEDAFRRSALIDAGHILVESNGGQVTLRGKVRSWVEREDAQHTAWSAPGVTAVKNEIAVG
jgi:osmotically-inducible protein OsmY